MQYAFCSHLITEEIRASFIENNIEIIPVKDCAALPSPTRSHADMLFFKACENLWIAQKGAFEALEITSPSVHFITDDFDLPTVEYPHDIRFNAALISGFLFCRERYVSPRIVENVKAKIVDIRQGYAKCSMCKVNEYSFITSDPSLKKAGDKCGLDVLLISPGYIGLDGYDYGFIGGASGLCGKRLFFFGDITKHPNYNEIHSFIKSRGVEEIMLSKNPLYDYGGVLFV